MSVTERLKKKKESLYAAIEQRFACAHPHRELRRRTIADGRPAYYRQCVRCGHAGRAISTKTVRVEAAGRPVFDFDDDAENRWGEAKSDEYSFAANELNQEFQLIYDDYLLSSQWRVKRTQILQRANGICELCEQSEAVNVHHKTYANLCCEPLEDLTAVCKFCHDYLHGKIEI